MLLRLAALLASALATKVTGAKLSASKSVPSASTTTAFKPRSSTPAPALCGNQGLEWGYWYNPYPYTKEPPSWPGYDPAYTNNADPKHVGTLPALWPFLYGNTTTTVDIYNQYNASQFYFTLNHQAYIWAPYTGNYTFKASYMDNNFNLWVGNTAYGYPYEQWNRNNSVLNIWVEQYSPTSVPVTGNGTYTVYWTGGTWNPVRFALGQAGGVLAMDLQVYDDEGADLFPYLSHSRSLVRYSCPADRKKGGKPFVPFGANYKKEVVKCNKAGGCVNDYGVCIAPGCYVGPATNRTCVAPGQGGCTAPSPYGH